MKSECQKHALVRLLVAVPTLCIVLVSYGSGVQAWSLPGHPELPPVPDTFSYHAVPQTCNTNNDCAANATCVNNRCHFGGWPVLLDYTSRSSSQGQTGLCYLYDKFHAFQTWNAYKLDSLWTSPGVTGHTWPLDETNRGIRLSFSPFLHCSPGSAIENFINQAGLVESCVEKSEVYDETTLETCGHYSRYRSLSITPAYQDPNEPDENYNECSPLQQGSTAVLAYRASSFTWLDPVYDSDVVFDTGPMSWVTIHLDAPSAEHMYFLARLLLEYGPFTTGCMWSKQWVPGHGPGNQLIPEVLCTGLGDGHNIAVIGYDFSVPGDERFFIQNSHNTLPNMKVYTIDYHDWTPLCGFGDHDVGYFSGVQDPVPWDPTNFLHPFHVFTTNGDLDLDGVVDIDDDDIDGDLLFNRWDVDPYNPWVWTDLDLDGHSDLQFRADAPRRRQKGFCVQFCNSMDLRPGVNNNLSDCQDRCEDWDRCMTLKIKNQSDAVTGCDWECLRKDHNPDCDPNADFTEYYSCCDSAERASMAACESTYKNDINADANNDGVGDACSALPTASELTFEYVHHSIEYMNEQGELEYVLDCEASYAIVSFWRLGGTYWEPYANDYNYTDFTTPFGENSSDLNTIYAFQPYTTAVDIGACGCGSATTDWANCSLNSCLETQETMANDWVWDPIEAVACEQIEDQIGGAAPYDQTCMSKHMAFVKEDDPMSPIVPFHELHWWFRDHQDWDSPGTAIDLQGVNTKVKVGWREPNSTNVEENTLFTSPSSILMPTIGADPACSAASPYANISPNMLHFPVAPHMEPGVPWTTLALGHAVRDDWLYVFDYRRNMTGPRRMRKATYPAGPTEGLTSGEVAGVVGRLSPALWGEQGLAEAVLFLMEASHGEAPPDPGEVPPGPGEQPSTGNQLWIGLISRADMPFYRAEDLLGQVLTSAAPALTDPQLAFDTVRGRLIAAGNEPGGQPALWAYAPKHASWSRLRGSLPRDLSGFTLVADPVRRWLYVVGGDQGGIETGKVSLVQLTSERVRPVPAVAPAGLARQHAALAVDGPRHRLYLFGGRAGDQLRADLWQLDLRTWQWQQLDDGTGPGAPSPRERAQLILEPRFGRLWIVGGRNDVGPLGVDKWVYSTATQAWQVRRIMDRSVPGMISGSIGADDLMTAGITVDATEPYPGKTLLISLESAEPCLGLRIRDQRQQVVTASLRCDPGARAVALLGQPGERYTLEVLPLSGFDRSQRPTFDIEVIDAQLVESAYHPTVHRPKGLAVDARTDGNIGLLLAGGQLSLYDLQDPGAPGYLGSSPVGHLSRDLALSGGLALVARMGPKPDVKIVDVTDPAVPTCTSGVSFPGPGRLVTAWGGKAYAAGVTRVNVILLGAQGGPAAVDQITPGGVVTAVEAHGGRLLVAAGGKLRLYDVQGGTSPTLLSEVALAQVGSAIAVQGSTVHVAEQSFSSWVRCLLGPGCDRQGIVEVFIIDDAGLLQPAGSYAGDARSLPYLHWSGAWALAIEGHGVVALHAEALP